MMDNLTELVKPETFNPSSLDTLETQTKEEPNTIENIQVVEAKPEEEVVPERSIPIITFPEWFTKYSENGDIKPVKIVIKGVNPDNILIVSYPTGNKLEDGSDEKDVELFKRANKIPALDLPASEINIYSNSFRMVQEYGDGIWIKSYGLKTNIILSFCFNVEGLLIPLYTGKVKKKERIVLVPTVEEVNVSQLAENLAKPADLQSLELRYKQSKGITATTNMDIVAWLFEKQKDISDINHHLQIDSVIMETLK